MRIKTVEKALAIASAFFSYIRLAASDIASGGDIRLRRVILPAAVVYANIIRRRNITFA